MAWIYLLIAGIFEVVWATAMKLSNGFSNLPYAALTLVGMIISFAGLVMATKHLPLSLAYPTPSGQELARLVQSLLGWSSFTTSYRQSLGFSLSC
ncbi:hypothetical protein FC49_GL000087 [Limosilactobacillus oris DSM 4864]|uniref:Uncharacterized protein n=1 Tax=Limosilactobacillus oris DSM 4864 TaxID=1423779 RepID=A0A0R1WG61_9LACO|nr:hypothetical protein FC49_GL000087 [Limosilactobacillus oris DSM 4864]